MNNIGMYQINYTPFLSRTITKGATTPIPYVQAQKTTYSPNFEQDYYAKQNAISINNQLLINRNNNYNIGRNIMNWFYVKYPSLNSFTMSETVAKNLERKNAYPEEILKAKEQADKDFKTMIKILEKRPGNKDITFNEYISQLEKEFQEYNHANCGERAYYLHNEMNKKGIDNTIIEIGGKEASNSHVFNVIGLEKDADINNPETWGKNAVVVDVWANKLLSPKDAVAFYKEFLNYTEDNPMKFEKLEVGKIFKSE